MKPKLVMTDSGTPLPPDWRQQVQAIRVLDEEPVNCPVCDALGFEESTDERGVLIRHPRRLWPCRAGVAA